MGKSPMPKAEFTPSKANDPPIKFSEMAGTDLHKPIGSQAASTRTNASSIEKNVFSFTEEPSDFEAEARSDVSSKTSEANSVKQEPQEATRHDRTETQSTACLPSKLPEVAQPAPNAG